MKTKDGGSAVVSDEARRDHERSIQGLHGVRYQSTDVKRAVAFYTNISASRWNTSSCRRSPPCPSAVSSCC